MIIQKSLILFLGGIILRVARLHDALHSRSDGGLRSSLRRSQRRLLELSGARHLFLGRLSSHGRRRLLPRLQSHPQSNHSILQLQRRPFFLPLLPFCPVCLQREEPGSGGRRSSSDRRLPGHFRDFLRCVPSQQNPDDGGYAGLILRRRRRLHRQPRHPQTAGSPPLLRGSKTER